MFRFHAELEEQDSLAVSSKDGEVSQLHRSASHLSLFVSSDVKEVPPCPFLSLEVGKEYKLGGFTGSASLPAAAGPILGSSEPVWRHQSCIFAVMPEERKNAKRLVIKAKTEERKPGSGSNGRYLPGEYEYPSFGLQGEYQLEVVLEKKGDQIVCTEVKGISGKVAIPCAISLALKTASAAKEGGRMFVRMVSLGMNVWTTIITTSIRLGRFSRV